MTPSATRDPDATTARPRSVPVAGSAQVASCSTTTAPPARRTSAAGAQRHGGRGVGAVHRVQPGLDHPELSGSDGYGGHRPHGAGLARAHREPVSSRPQEDPVTTTRTRRWRLAAAGIAIAATSFTTAACGSDTVDDGVEQEVEDAGNEVEEEVEGGDEDGDG